MDDDVIMKTLPGRPSQFIITNKFVKINSIQEINNSYIGKEGIIIYKYTNKMFGNFHKDVFCNGIFSNCNYETYICIHDYKIKKNISISKKRFLQKNTNFELYIKNYIV